MVVGTVAGAPSALGATTTTFSYTGAEQVYPVPLGTTAVTITAVGAPGGASYSGVAGGDGATVTATVPLPAGTTTLFVEVGGAGTPGPCHAASGDIGGGGFNGGGGTVCGGGGGGASDVRTTSIDSVPDSALTSLNDSRLVVAGGGGGAGNDCGAPGGRAGDGSVAGAGAGSAGSDVCDGAGPGGNGGLGGSSGGAGGAGTADYPCRGGGGSLGLGGDTSAVCDDSNYGGAGGGGYYGGGAGGDGFAYGGAGGAGASFWTSGATNTSMSEDSTATPEVEITPVVTAPDLELSDTAPATVASGHSFSYRLVVTDSGGSGLDDVAVADALPDSAKYDSASATQGTCTRAAPATGPKPKGGTLSCVVGSLDAGQSATVTITMTATTPGQMSDDAAATAPGVGWDADDDASAATTVQGG
jgi:hypothetical protein